MAILAEHATIFERASIDEAYIDITANVKKMIGKLIGKEGNIIITQNTVPVGHQSLLLGTHK